MFNEQFFYGADSASFNSAIFHLKRILTAVMKSNVCFTIFRPFLTSVGKVNRMFIFGTFFNIFSFMTNGRPLKSHLSCCIDVLSYMMSSEARLVYKLPELWYLCPVPVPYRRNLQFLHCSVYLWLFWDSHFYAKEPKCSPSVRHACETSTKTGKSVHCGIACGRIA